jgi:hypothetical protein
MIDRGLSSKPWVIAIDPWRKGFGYGVFEGQHSLIDWGLRRVSGLRRNRRCLEKLDEMLNAFHPDLLVMERWNAPDSRRCNRTKIFLHLASRMADSHGIPTVHISRKMVNKAFANSAGEPTKYAIAQILAEDYPWLAKWLPAARKPWMSEDTRMCIFDACALAIAYYRSRNAPRENQK